MGYNAWYWIRNSDLSYFNSIVPCGIDDKLVTSLQEELQDINMTDLKNKFKNNFIHIFNIELLEN